MGGHVTRHLAAYEEGELSRNLRDQVERHLGRCRRCAARHLAVRDSIREVSAGLVAEAIPEMVAGRIRRRFRSADAMESAEPSRPPAAAGWLAPAVAALLMVGVLITVWLLQPVAGPVRLLIAEQPDLPFESLARSTHLDLSRGDRVLEYASNSPDKVRRWVEEQTAVRLNLVDGRAPGEDDRYRVLGASRLVGPGGVTVAAVLYEVDGRLTTLLATHQANEPGAPRWSTGRKRVLFRPGDGISQLTWTNSGNAYSVVTALPDAGREACGICHRTAPLIVGPLPDV